MCKTRNLYSKGSIAKLTIKTVSDFEKESRETLERYRSFNLGGFYFHSAVFSITFFLLVKAIATPGLGWVILPSVMLLCINVVVLCMDNTEVKCFDDMDFEKLQASLERLASLQSVEHDAPISTYYIDDYGCTLVQDFFALRVAYKRGDMNPEKLIFFHEVQFAKCVVKWCIIAPAQMFLARLEVAMNSSAAAAVGEK